MGENGMACFHRCEKKIKLKVKNGEGEGKMAIRLSDVAKEAGVSPTTVSRVINRRGYLSQKTIHNVEAAMRKLNYHPNASAKHLQAQKTMTIGILVPSISNPFFGQLTFDLEQQLFQEGFNVLIGNAVHDPQKERTYLGRLLGHEVDGLIVATHNKDIPEYANANLPIVSIDRFIRTDIPNVSSDNVQGERMATEALIKRGARYIIHTDSIALNKHDTLREEAYREVMNQHHRDPITYQVDFEALTEEKIATFTKMLDQYPETDGIVASNDTDACVIYSVLLSRGLRVPEDVQLIGYDGAQTTQSIFPGLATIEQPIQKMATLAIQVLKKKIDRQEVDEEYVLPVRLKEGTTIKQL